MNQEHQVKVDHPVDQFFKKHKVSIVRLGLIIRDISSINSCA
jgi:hypothetical protein